MNLNILTGGVSARVRQVKKLYEEGNARIFGIVSGRYLVLLLLALLMLAFMLGGLFAELTGLSADVHSAGGNAHSSGLNHSFWNSLSGQLTFVLNIMLVGLCIWFGRKDSIALRQADRSERHVRIADRLAVNDKPRGCYNIRSAGERIALLLEEAEKRNMGFSAMVFYIGGLRWLMDEMAGEEGRKALERVTDAIRKEAPARAELAILGEGLLACYFVCDSESHDKVENLASKLSHDLSKNMSGALMALDIGEMRESDSRSMDTADEHSSGPEIAIGACFIPRVKNPVNPLLNARLAMRKARQSGMQICFWNDDMERERQYRKSIEHGLKSALLADEIKPWYQGQYDMQTRRLLGFEVLSRWQSVQMGVIAPRVFLNVAEDRGSISEITHRVMYRAMVDARCWDPNVSLSFNFSDRQLRDPWFAQQILKILCETGFPANRLEIELSENSLIADISQSRTILSSLHNQGVRIVLDEFGSGYSSLALLRTLPISRVKIDRQFVTSLVQDESNRKLVQTIANMGQTMNFAVSAVGVEDQETADFLISAGCRLGQGHYFDQPMPISQVRRVLAEKNMLHTGSGHDAPAELSIESLSQDPASAGNIRP